MEHPVKGVDHVFLLVEDLDRSQEQFRRLGFTVSPRGLHSAHKGSANHTIMFPEDYFELLGLIADTEQNASRREMLARDGQGLHAVACRIDDAAAAAQALDALGIATSGLSDFSRPVPLPGGGEGLAAFSTLLFEPEEIPLGLAFMCQHRTREMVWQPELLDHPNGAAGLAGILAGVAEPETSARRYARLFAAGLASAIEGGFEVRTGSAPLLFLSEEALAARYGGLDMTSTPRNAFAAMQVLAPDLDKVRRLLGAAEIPFVVTKEGIAVDPAHGSGAVVEFVAR
ncbi:VOC family protein [Geminicoccaceae bacterium 1502E]|nr:VOC family protein [Geminicoccaceae bacterium 1502E]